MGLLRCIQCDWAPLGPVSASTSDLGYRSSYAPPPPSVTRFEPGPVRLMSIAHAFNYRIAVLQSGIKQAARTAHSKKAERCFLDGVSLTWGQQVAVMFQIVCTLTLAVPAVAGGVTDFHGSSPDVLLSSEPWGHADHTGITCRCRSSDQTGAYIHAADRGDPADPRPSLLCACTIPAAECPPPAPLRDTEDGSAADVVPVTYPDLVDPSPADFAPATLQNSADPSLLLPNTIMA